MPSMGHIPVVVVVPLASGSIHYLPGVFRALSEQVRSGQLQSSSRALLERSRGTFQANFITTPLPSQCNFGATPEPFHNSMLDIDI